MPGTGYTSISDYLGANQDTVAREQGDLAGDVSGALDKAQASADTTFGNLGAGQDYTAQPGYLDNVGQWNDAVAKANELKTGGGLADLLKQHYAAPTYTPSQAAFDSQFLVGANAFAPVQAKAQSLSDYLDKHTSEGGNPVPLPTPEVDPRPLGPHEHMGAGQQPGLDDERPRKGNRGGAPAYGTQPADQMSRARGNYV